MNASYALNSVSLSNSKLSSVKDFVLNGTPYSNSEVLSDAAPVGEDPVVSEELAAQVLQLSDLADALALWTWSK